jgi:hypothetical protein
VFFFHMMRPWLKRVDQVNLVKRVSQHDARAAPFPRICRCHSEVFPAGQGKRNVSHTVTTLDNLELACKWPVYFQSPVTGQPESQKLLFTPQIPIRFCEKNSVQLCYRLRRLLCIASPFLLYKYLLHPLCRFTDSWAVVFLQQHSFPDSGRKRITPLGLVRFHHIYTVAHALFC